MIMLITPGIDYRKCFIKPREGLFIVEGFKGGLLERGLIREHIRAY
jgi:hypothetical protein